MRLCAPPTRTTPVCRPEILRPPSCRRFDCSGAQGHHGFDDSGRFGEITAQRTIPVRRTAVLANAFGLRLVGEHHFPNGLATADRRIKRTHNASLVPDLLRCATQFNIHLHRSRRQGHGEGTLAAEYSFGAIQSRMSRTRFGTRALDRIGTQMSLRVLACHLKRTTNLPAIARRIEARETDKAAVSPTP